MALQGSGAISANDVNLEIGESGTHTFSMNNAEERELADKPTSGSTISFSDFYGKRWAFDHYVEFRFTVEEKKIGSSDYEHKVGFSISDGVGTGVDLTDGMQDKTGVNHTWHLYSCMPAKFFTSGSSGGGGPIEQFSFGDSETNYQSNTLSIYKNTGNTVGSAYDWGYCRIRIKNSSGSEIFTAVKSNPVNGVGDGSKFINNMLAGSTPDSANGVAEQLWLALYNVRNTTVTISFEFYD